MKDFQVNGIIPAQVTSFNRDGTLDLEGVRKNTEYLISTGVWGILVCGSTGEAAALEPHERVQVVQTAKQTAQGRVKIIAGTGAPVTAETIRLSQQAQEAGADALLVITPFYVIPTQDGLYAHFKAVNDAVDIPIIMYNLPQHTLVDFEMETLQKLAALKNIVGLKESSCRTGYVANALALVGKKISIIEGGDDVVYPSLCLGVAGSIVALGNLAPKELVAIFNHVRAGEYDQAREVYFQILPIARAISVSENFPAGVKAGVELLGRPAGPARPPVMITGEEKASIKKALKASKLL
jgi:4-hydroxy-tetrahydrodipicolinate synthase